MSFITKLFPDESKKLIKKLQPIVERVFSHEDELKSLTDEELKSRSLALKEQVQIDIAGLTGKELKETEKKVLKWLKGIKNPKPVLKAIGYFISDDGETKSEISQNSY